MEGLNYVEEAGLLYLSKEIYNSLHFLIRCDKEGSVDLGEKQKEALKRAFLITGKVKVNLESRAD